MEQVLDTYKREYDPKNPVICFDESPKQLIGEIRQPIEASSGKVRRYDSEYKRNGVCNIFMIVEPLAGKRYITVTEHRKKSDWSLIMKQIVDYYYRDAERVTIVQDNLNIHNPANLYEYYEPSEAKRIIDKLEFVNTPKHGSWLNIAEIELSVLHNTCLKARIETKEEVNEAVKIYEENRNNNIKKINWQFKTEDARIKLKKLYPSL